MAVKFRVFFGMGFILVSMIAWGDIDIDSQDIGSEEITKPAKRTPFSFSTHIDVIAPAEIEKGFHKGDKIHFAEAQAEAGLVVYYCPAYTEGVRLAIAYTPTYLRWAENPWFDQDRFHTVNFIFSGFTKRFDRWFWRSQVSVNADADQWKASYTSYDILLWGRYVYCKNVGIHLGFLAQTGLRLDRVYPVIGFDWQISPKWRLDLVYPVNIGLTYAVTPRWSFAVAARFFNSRFRVHHKEIFSKALVRYTNVGTEFAIKYEIENMSANIHAGAALDGKFRVANRKNHHAHIKNLKPSGYVGCEMDVKF
jgi:hypothetical protein